MFFAFNSKTFRLVICSSSIVVVTLITNLIYLSYSFMKLWVHLAQLAVAPTAIASAVAMMDE
jgi:hypothetical protein